MPFEAVVFYPHSPDHLNGLDEKEGVSFLSWLSSRHRTMSSHLSMNLDVIMK